MALNPSNSSNLEQLALKGLSVCAFTSGGTACPRAADIVLILDQSSSIVQGDPTYSNWYERMLGFATAIVEAFPIDPSLTRVSRFGIRGVRILAFL